MRASIVIGALLALTPALVSAQSPPDAQGPTEPALAEPATAETEAAEASETPEGEGETPEAGEATRDESDADAAGRTTMETYRDLVGRAIREFDGHNFEEALALFEQAYAIRPSARVLRGMGKVRFELRQYVRALEAFDLALDTDLDPLTDAMRAEVEELRTRSRRFVGELRVRVTPADATITIDGRELPPNTRFPIRIDMGAHEVSASSRGRQTATRTIDVQGGRSTTVRIELLESGGYTMVVQRTRDTTPAWIVGMTGLGFFASSVGSAIWLWLRIEAFDQCTAGEARGLTCTTRGSIEAERQAASGTFIVSAGLTLAAAVAFPILLATAGGETLPDSPVSASCGAGPEGATCTLRGRF